MTMFDCCISFNIMNAAVIYSDNTVYCKCGVPCNLHTDRGRRSQFDNHETAVIGGNLE